jgi:hypothetical protein
MQKKSEEEIEILKHNLRTWDVLQVRFNLSFNAVVQRLPFADQQNFLFE